MRNTNTLPARGDHIGPPPPHRLTTRAALIKAIHAFEPGMGGLDECSNEELIATLVDVTGVEHVDADQFR